MDIPDMETRFSRELRQSGREAVRGEPERGESASHFHPPIWNKSGPKESGFAQPATTDA